MSRMWNCQIKITLQNMNIKNVSALSLLICFILNTYSNDSYSQQNDTFTYTETNPTGNLNPFGEASSRASNDRLFSLIYEPLFRFDYFEEEFSSVLADELNLTNNNTTYNLSLKEDVYWHDNVELTSEDVKFTIEYIINSDESIRNRDLYINLLDYIEIHDDHNISIHLHDPYEGRYAEGFLPNWILPSHLFNEDYTPIDSDSELSSTPIGTGPYKFINRSMEGNVQLEKFSDYWGTTPEIEQIQMELSSDPETMVMRLTSRIISLVIDVPSVQIPSVEATGRHRIIPYQSYRIQTIGFNFRNDRLNDKNLRQAIVYGTNREEMLNEWFGGRGNLLVDPFTPESPYYDIEREPYPFDPQKARELIEEAGYSFNSNSGFYENDNNEPITFDFVVPVMFGAGDDSPVQNIATSFRNNMRDIGIEINVINEARDEYENTIYRDHNFDLVYVEWEFDPQYNITHLFHSRYIGDQGTNVIAYDNSSVDNRLESFETADDSALQRGHIRNVQDIIYDEVPYMFMFTADNNAAIDHKYTGIRIDPFYFFTYINRWGITE